MAPRLLDDPLARVDQDHGQIGRRRARDHVARVALVPRRVRDDELALGGLEVAVGDVDRDALLALGAQPVGEQRQIERVLAVASLGGRAQGLELVGEDLLGVEQEPPDQGALAVVHRAGDDQPQQRARLRLVGQRRRRLPRNAGAHVADGSVGHGCRGLIAAWGVMAADRVRPRRHRQAEPRLPGSPGARLQLAAQREQVVVEVDLHRVALGGHVAPAHPLVARGACRAPSPTPVGKSVLTPQVGRDPASLGLGERHRRPQRLEQRNEEQVVARRA